ncbi:tyrosinase family protein [Anabaena azotica]|uniref:Tyrosinase family protein n=1 Tax=Anabaena azotica FACHB-119 TaxID=947527 RepID=A0ABR8D7N7_9NOST|nr:tyrosinase family protein [Anabaena azotica]MBD2503177.1 tyrosinase family protein [Anabaena azotica FACHB-119]
MAIEIEINGTLNANARYVAYAPSPSRIRLAGATTENVKVQLSSRPAQPGGGVVVFYSSRNQPSKQSLELTLPADGSWVAFEIGGKFGFPSVNDKDSLLVVNGLGNEITIPLMVRVRKNANNLTQGERDRFLEAYGQLNNAGTGIYQDFRDSHVQASDLEAHKGPQFLPWHRAFLLDLERELQIVDPSVSLPYWRFDEPAPKVFQADFIGQTRQVPEDDDGTGDLVVFNIDNPLVAWATDGVPGVLRSARFDTLTSPASGVTIPPFNFPVLTEAQTLALGDVYAEFTHKTEGIETLPHASAHVSFTGSISYVPTAAKDPLFFLLHANIDRLWALWQWFYKRINPQELESYTPEDRDGRRLADTMWPWNGVVTPPRPNFAPGGWLADSTVTSSPGKTPKVEDTIDFQGYETSTARLGYSYDNVPYEFSKRNKLKNSSK